MQRQHHVTFSQPTKELTEGGELREAQVNVPRSLLAMPPSALPHRLAELQTPRIMKCDFA